MTSIKKWALCLVALLAMSGIAAAEMPDGFSEPTWYDFRDNLFNINGRGTFSNPIVVSTAEELAQISWLVNEQGIAFDNTVIVLGADIDLKKEVDGKLVSWIPIGKNSSRCFEGVFIGVNTNEQGWEKHRPYTISNMYLSAGTSTYTNHFGLFGYCSGFVGYLAMDHPTVIVTSTHTDDAAGCVCGTMVPSTVTATDLSGTPFQMPSTVYATSVTHATMTVGGISDVGGIVGKSSKNGLCHVSFEGDITTSSNNVGGICGQLERAGKIYDCTANVNIKGGTNVGGIVGLTGLESYLEACASSGTLTDGSCVGGICGKQMAVSVIGCCSSAATVSGNGKIGGITGWSGNNQDVESNVSKMVCCVFTGHIHPTGYDYNAGGICGHMSWKDNLGIERCLFAGRIDDPRGWENYDKFGLIVGRNSTPNSIIANCYIDLSMCVSAKVAGSATTHPSVQYLTTPQLITGKKDDTPLLEGDTQWGHAFTYQAGFYPRPTSSAAWGPLSDFRASGCSEACRKLFHKADMLSDYSVYLPQSWLCSVPLVVSKGDCVADFVSTAEVKRATTTIETASGTMKLRNNCLFPETSCIDVSGDVISAREQGECVVSYTSSQDVEPCFARPVLPQALKPVTFNVTLGSLWYGKIAGACAAGTGTVDDPYLIKNGDQLAYAIKNNKADEFYEQICDIMLNEDLQYKITTNANYLEWIPDNWSTPTWKAHYDGAGHFISGAFVHKTGCGLFGNIAASGTVANLGVIDSRGPYKGGIFAGTMDGTITNCIVQGQVSGIAENGTEYFKAGGFCAIVGQNSVNALIEDCITAASSGFFSYADYSPFVSLSDDNKGEVRNCLTVVPMTNLDKDYHNSGITVSGKDYIKDCYWLKGYEEMPTGYNLQDISDKLGKRARWQTTMGYFPMLKTFAGTDIAKLLMVPFRTDVDYVYDEEKGESDNFLLGMGHQILFEPGSATWTTTDIIDKFLEVDTDMGVVVPMRESYDYGYPNPEFGRTIPGMIYVTGTLGKAKHYIPVRARRGNLNAGFSFEDANARQACLDAFDTNHDNVLSLAELKAATNEQTITAFQTATARQIKAFPEFRFFKNVSELTTQLNNLSLLEKVQLPYALQTIGAEAFKGCTSLKQVTVPSRLTAVKPAAFYNSKVENILVDPFNTLFTSRDGVLFTKDDALVAYPNGRVDEEAVVTGTVSAIAAGAFYKVHNLSRLFFDTTDYTTVPQLADGALNTESGSLMDVYVSDATEGHVLLSGYLNDPLWAPYVRAKKLHQYYPLKITNEAPVSGGYLGTFYIGFATKLPMELTPYIFNSTDAENNKAYYHEKSKLVPPLAPVMVIAGKTGTYRLQPVEGEVERWPVYQNCLIGAPRDGLDLNQATAEQGSILTPQVKDGKAGFYPEKKTMIEPYHCYLTFNTVGMTPEAAKNSYYDLVRSEQTLRSETQGDYTFAVKQLKPDGKPYAELTSYNGAGGNIVVPAMLSDNTPVTNIAGEAFYNPERTISSIDMTGMIYLEPFDTYRKDRNSPIAYTDDYTLVYVPQGKATAGTNVIVGDQCADLKLFDGHDFYAPFEFHAAKVSYDRVLRATDNGDGTWTSKAYTLCLPYAIDIEEQVGNITDVEANTLHYVNTDFDKKQYDFAFHYHYPKLVAGGGYMIVVKKGELNLNAEDVDVVSEPTDWNVVDWKTKDDCGKWRGTFSRISNDDAAKSWAYHLNTDGKFRRISNEKPEHQGAYVGAFRAAYFANSFSGRNTYNVRYADIYPGGDDENPDRIVNFPVDEYEGDGPYADYDEEDSNGIRQIKERQMSDGKYYDLQGRQLTAEPTKGIYIINGRKIIK